MAASCSYSSTKQRSDSECVDDDSEDPYSNLDCTMSLDVDGDSGDLDSVIFASDFAKGTAQAEARKKSKATSASATCTWKHPLCIESNSNLNGRVSFYH